ncbi:MAG: tyrosine-protein phosphatase [Clostridia bacterium]|nr:tyrosine-protein phosphatase [Clostridia bacterium]
MITITSPENGAKFNLMSDIQLEFLATDRTNAVVEELDWMHLEVKTNKDETTPRRIPFVWEPAVKGVLQVSKSADFTDALTFEGEGGCTVDNLHGNTTYFARVVAGDEVSDAITFSTADAFATFFRVDGALNVRDCGGRVTEDGRRIKQGLIYRGSELNSHLNVTEEGLKTLREVLKIKTVLDLRNPEAEDIQNPYGGEYVQISCAAYGDYMQKHTANKKLFEFLSDENNYPVYFHCWGGADRTGTLAFMLGALLGEKYDNLVDDYELTSLTRYGGRSRNSKLYHTLLDKLNCFVGDTVNEKVESFMLYSGVTPEQITKIREIFLQD